MVKPKRTQFLAIPKPLFFSVIAVIFGGLAGKVAFTSQFPLPFDEGFHVGLIRFYAHHLNPFITSQPATADSLGAVTRDPSYLYHYLMSFPFRLITLITSDQLTQVWLLRGLNIALGMVTLGLLYKLARRCGVPPMASQLAVLALAITPVFYDLAAQVNYDNLMLPLTLGSVLLCLRIRDQLRAGRVSALAFGGLCSLLLLTSLVKYSFLPIMLAIGIYMTVLVIRQIGWRTFGGRLAASFRKTSRLRQFALVACILLSGLLWAQRYGVNIVSYHTPHPQCNAVMSVADCSHYAPWARNYQLHQSAVARPSAGLQLVAFTRYWLRSVYIQLFCMAHLSTNRLSVVYTPNDMLKNIAKVAIAFGGLCALLTWRVFMRQRSRWGLFAVIGSLYLLTLWGQNFSDFHNLHAIVAIQGRYLLPVLPFVYIAVAASTALVAQDVRRVARLARRRVTLLPQLLTAHTWYKPFTHGPRTYP